MKKNILLVLLSIYSLALLANSTDSIAASKIKTGWNFGALPSVAFDSDLGFQYGIVTNIFNYGDGTQYPEYLHSLFVELAYTTKRYGIFRVFYDSKYLIPNHRVSIDASFLPDAMSDFYGYNGYQSVYNTGWHNNKKDTTQYLTRAFYKYKRDLFRFAGDIEGSIAGNLKWNAGAGVLGYMLDNVDIEFMNKGRKPEKQLPDIDGMYQKYIDWGLIAENEKNGGWHPYLRGGLTYDSRNKRTNPNKGIHADAFLTYTSAWGNQAEYNNLKLNACFRHYVSLHPQYLTLAYRVGTQVLLAGESPFYLNSYQNSLFIQRAMYEAVGGASSVRGILRNRISANGFVYANVELRSKLIQFDIAKQHFYIGINPFMDLGMIVQPYELNQTAINDAISANNAAKGLNDKVDDYFNFDTSGLYLPHISVGLGLKIAMNENFVLSVDWATPTNKQDNANVSNLYIKVGYLF